MISYWRSRIALQMLSMAFSLALAMLPGILLTVPADAAPSITQPIGTQPIGAQPIGQPAPEFALEDLRGERHALRDYRGRLVLLTFISARCPISRAYQDRIRNIAGEYRARDVVFLAINSSANEDRKEVARHASEHRLDFTILKDDGNLIADAYEAERTPKVYLIDQAGILRYRGRIDNSQNPRMVNRQDLKIALDELLAGRPVSIAETQAMGCLIDRARPSTLAQARRQSPVRKPGQSVPAPGRTVVPRLKPAGYSKLISESAGRVVVVNFWATWCPPCVAEFPELVRLDQQLRSRGVRFIGITADDLADLDTEVVPFLNKQKAGYENFIQDVDDPQEMIDVVNKDWPGVLPATFVYDRKGSLVFTRLGIVDRDVLLNEIEKALKSH